MYSPLSLLGLCRAVVQAVRYDDDSRPRLLDLLRREYRAAGAVLCGTGTQALQLALQVAQETVDSAVVALPSFTCFDVASAAVGAGSTITLYDIDPCTLAPDLDTLERSLDAGARTVVLSPLYGLPLDWDGIEECVARHGAIAIEDAAQGHGARWRGDPIGSFGQLSVLSFGRGKGWTGARGGALLLREETLRGRMDGLARDDPGFGVELRSLFIGVAQWTMGRPSLYGLPSSIPWLGLGETHYRSPSPPQPMTRAAAALVEHSQAQSVHESAARRANARALLDKICFGPRVRPLRLHPEGTVGFLRLPLRLSRGVAGFDDPKHATRLGILPSYPSTLASLPQVRARMTEPRGRWPGGEELVRQLVTLPTHSLVTQEEQAELLRLLNTYRR